MNCPGDNIFADSGFTCDKHRAVTRGNLMNHIHHRLQPEISSDNLAAGNSDEDSEFYDAIPSSFDLPNILTVGAVDLAGEETSFSSFGDNVDVHANGFDVESFVPGGDLLKMSGTSMSCPNVANLAGKILAINPKLSVEDVKNYIISYSDISEDGRTILMNPKATIEAVDKDKPSVKTPKGQKKLKS